MGTLCQLFCSSGHSWHHPNLSPAALATHHSQHCSQTGTWMLRRLEQVLAPVQAPVLKQGLACRLVVVVAELGVAAPGNRDQCDHSTRLSCQPAIPPERVHSLHCTHMAEVIWPPLCCSPVATIVAREANTAECRRSNWVWKVAQHSPFH